MPLVHGDRLVEMTLVLFVQPGITVRIVRERERQKPLQGLQLAIDSGTLWVKGVESPKMVLWGDTSPRKTKVRVDSKERTRLHLWNCWRSPRGYEDAWTTNAGMSIQELGAGKFRAECNAGSEITFDDLVVRIVAPGAVRAPAD
ncbi:MAG: hypothetical protein JJ863_12205 [Deltaproteobacteria bacterium]|nr:hypothetical protein [Deltaproteobacteria bacterium]